MTFEVVTEAVVTIFACNFDLDCVALADILDDGESQTMSSDNPVLSIESLENLLSIRYGSAKGAKAEPTLAQRECDGRALVAVFDGVGEIVVDESLQLRFGDLDKTAIFDLQTDRSLFGASKRCKVRYTLFEKKQISWDAADRQCVQHGGRLASLNTQDDWYQVVNLMNHLFLKEFRFYIGLRVASRDKPSL